MTLQRSRRPVPTYREGQSQECNFCFRLTHYRASGLGIPICHTCAETQYVENLPTGELDYRRRVRDFHNKFDARARYQQNAKVRR
jgi:hypothetical protein